MMANRFLQIFKGLSSSAPKQTTYDDEEDIADTAYNRRWLLQCAKEGNYETIHEMVHKGVTPNFQDAEGKSPLMVAVETKNVELVKLLTRCIKLNANLRDKENGASALILAIKKLDPGPDRSAIVESLLKMRELDLDDIDKEGYSPLTYAALFGDFYLVQKLIDAGANVNLGNEVNGKINTPVHYAKVGGFDEITALLESKGAKEFVSKNEILDFIKKPDPYAVSIQITSTKRKNSLSVDNASDAYKVQTVTLPTDTKDDTPQNRELLLESIRNGNLEKSTELVLKGVNPNCSDEWGQTPLLLAIDRTDPELVRCLLQSPKTDVNFPDKDTGTTPLIAASKQYATKRIPIVKMLLEKPGVNVNAQDDEGQTALIFSALFGDTEVGKMLIDAGADVGLGPESGDSIQTPLYFAKLNEHENFISLLKTHGCTTELISSSSRRKRANAKSMKIVLDNPPPRKLSLSLGSAPVGRIVKNKVIKITLPDDSKADTNYNRTMLLLNVKQCNENGVKYLIEKGVSPNYVNEEGNFPLLEAVNKKNLEVLKILLSSPKSDVNLKNEDGKTALMAAVSLPVPESLKIVEILLSETGINVNEINSEGQTPLIAAVKQGNFEMSKILLEGGADPSIGNNNNEKLENAIFFAKQRNNKEIISLLSDPPKVSKPSAPKNVANTSSQPQNKDMLSKADTNYNRSMLLLNVKKGESSQVERLLKKGVSPNFVDDSGSGDTPISVAVDRKDVNMIKLLVSSPLLDINTVPEESGSPPLLYIAKSKPSSEKLEILKLILDIPGIDLNIKDTDGKNALALAASDPEAIKILQAGPTGGAKRQLLVLDSQKKMDETPNNTTPKDSTMPAFKPKRKLRKNFTANNEGPVAKVVKKVEIEKSADTNWNRSMLMLNVKKGQADEVERLITKGVSPNFVDEEGHTPVMITIEQNFISILRLLLSSPKIDPNFGDDTSGVTPLIFSVKKRHPDRLEIIKLLLSKRGIDVNAQDEQGKTALVIAVQNEDLEACKLLLDAGADVNLGSTTVDRTETPLYFAKLVKNESLISLLQQVEKGDTTNKPSTALSKEKELRKALVNIQGTSSNNSSSTSTTQVLLPQFSEKVFVRVKCFDPITKKEIGKGWKKFIYRSVDNRKILRCFDMENNSEVPELVIDFSKLNSEEEILMADVLSEPHRFAFAIPPLKLIFATETQKGRELWVLILKRLWKYAQPEGQKKAPVEDPNRIKNMLLNCINERRKDLLSEIISKGILVNFLIEGRSLLTMAIETSDVDIVKILVSSPKVDINILNEDGSTPLIVAVKHPVSEKRLEIVKVLLQNNQLNVNAQDKNGRTALVFSSVWGDIDVSQLLLDRNADPNLGRKSLDKIETPLYYAIQSKNESLTSLLLSRGAKKTEEATSKDTIQQTGKYLTHSNPEINTSKPNSLNEALIQCINNGHIRGIGELIKQGVSPNFRDARGRTPLIIAIERAEKNLVRILLMSPKIDINFPDNTKGKTPLMAAAKLTKPERIDTIQILLQKPGININAQNKRGKTALCYSARNGDVEVVKILLRLRADINLGKEGPEGLKTPLVYAKKGNHSTLVSILRAYAELKEGERVQLPEKNIEADPTPTRTKEVNKPSLERSETLRQDPNQNAELNRKLLFHYAKKKNYHAIGDLIKLGVDTNLVIGGQTALTHAIESADINLLRLLLLSPKTNLNLRPSENRVTPLILATRQNVSEKLLLVKLLLRQQSKGLDVNAQDKDGRTALVYATHQGDVELVKELLLSKADPFLGASSEGTIATPLYYAKANNYKQLIDLLTSYESEYKANNKVVDPSNRENTSSVDLQSLNTPVNKKVVRGVLARSHTTKEQQTTSSPKPVRPSLNRHVDQ